MERRGAQVPIGRGRLTVAVILVATAYAVAGRFGQVAALPPGNVTPIWPASGVALAALLMIGNRLWPGVWLGSFAVNLWVALERGEITLESLAGMAGVATGAAAATALSARLLRHDSDRILNRATGVVRFVFLGAILSSLITATVGTLSFFGSHVVTLGHFAETWTTWLMGDTTGILVVTPLLLAWRRRDEAPLAMQRIVEAIAVFVFLATTCVLVFSVAAYPVFFILIPFLLTAAFRYGQRGTTLAMLTVSSISVLFTAQGIGPFVNEDLTRNESLLLLQGFTAVLVLTLLFLSAVLAEREEKTREAHDAELRLQEEHHTRNKMEEELRTASIIESSADMISRRAPDGRLLYVSHAALPLLGFEPLELVGQSIYDLIDRDVVSEIRELEAMLMRESGVCTLSYRLRKKNDDYVWFETTSRAIRKDGEIEEIVSVSREISDRKRAEEQIEHQVYHDVLTGLPNRILFEDRASVALARAKRNNSLVAVLFLDLDRFKNVNDTFGHAVGDQILQTAAGRLAETIREADTLARIGGDEFVGLIGDLRDSMEAVKVAQKIITSMQRPFSVESHEVSLSISVGIALYPVDGTDVDTLLRCADRAMYRAKLLGGSSHEIHTPALSANRNDVSVLESELRVAITRGELEVFYQPQLDLVTGKTVAAEALVRWRHPTRGLMLPDSFIPLAEDSRIIMRLGEFVIERACRDLSGWLAQGLPEIRIAVNLSAVEFADRHLVDMIRRILDETGAPAHLLELEITETSLMHNAERTLDMLKQLKTMGLQLVIDDFGIGYSSLSYLQQFPVDSVKIDRSFVSGINARGGDHAIISAVVQLAKALNLRVIAEGVESEEQVRLLKGEDCHHGQGFLFARPMGASDFGAFLQSERATESTTLANSEPA